MIAFDIHELIRQNIDRIMKVKGITPAELSRKLGMESSYIAVLLRPKKGNKDTAKRNPKPETLLLIADVLNVDIREFYAGIATGEHDGFLKIKVPPEYKDILQEIQKIIKKAIEANRPVDVMLERLKRFTVDELEDLAERKKEDI